MFLARINAIRTKNMVTVNSDHGGEMRQVSRLGVACAAAYSSALAPDIFTTSAQVAISWATKAASSAGVGAGTLASGISAPCVPSSGLVLGGVEATIVPR